MNTISQLIQAIEATQTAIESMQELKDNHAPCDYEKLLLEFNLAHFRKKRADLTKQLAGAKLDIDVIAEAVNA